MFSINLKQHSKILGFALIAYGLQFLPRTFVVLKEFSGIFNSDRQVPLMAYLSLPFDSMILPFWILMVSIVSGVTILLTNTSAKFLSLSFVFLTITFFPLETILSFYVLCYLFVISENKIEIKENLPEEI